MPQKAWSPRRDRQYEHIKDSYEERGVSEDEAEERAARTVNKERAEHGETKRRRSSAG
jgi:plasmid stabilization system protein ParE